MKDKAPEKTETMRRTIKGKDWLVLRAEYDRAIAECWDSARIDEHLLKTARPYKAPRKPVAETALSMAFDKGYASAGDVRGKTLFLFRFVCENHEEITRLGGAVPFLASCRVVPNGASADVNKALNLGPFILQMIKLK